MRYWNGHRWVDRCDACERTVDRYPHVCGPYALPIEVTREQLEDARANPLRLVERMMNERDVGAEDRLAAVVLGFVEPGGST